MSRKVPDEFQCQLVQGVLVKNKTVKLYAGKGPLRYWFLFSAHFSHLEHLPCSCPVFLLPCIALIYHCVTWPSTMAWGGQEMSSEWSNILLSHFHSTHDCVSGLTEHGTLSGRMVESDRDRFHLHVCTDVRNSGLCASRLWRKRHAKSLHNTLDRSEGVAL